MSGLDRPAGQRRATRAGDAGPDAPRVERVDGMWRIRSLEAARQVLRARHQTTQAGFTAEFIPQGRLEHRPILISDGPLHDEQRSAVARFFAPATVQGYAGQIAACADRLLDDAARRGTFCLDDLALQYTVDVTAAIVGLTHEVRGDTPVRRDRRIAAMARRLVSFFDQPPFDLTKPNLGREGRDWARAARKALWPVATYAACDVLPALRQRRRHPRDDVISNLVSRGWSTPSILVEAVTYGTAGMVTTREFIGMAAWHLLTTPDLAAHYRAADQSARILLLQELIRLEPVVGHLYRRAQAPIEVTDGDQRHLIEPGDLVDVQVRDANADPRAMDDPLAACPHRPLPAGVRASVLSFGDGAHKCPGEPLALLEADLLLTRLLARGPRIVAEPRIGWDDLVSGYELRDFRLSIDDDQ